MFLLHHAQILTGENFQQISNVYWRQADAQQMLGTTPANLLLQSMRKMLADQLTAHEEKMLRNEQDVVPDLTTLT